MTTTLYYSPHGDDTYHRHEVTVDGDYDLSDDTWNDSLAEQCAKDWHSNCDGWEGVWPRVFALYRDTTGPAFARFQVDREYEPSFSASAC